ncbi:electron transfer flavoprotein subunit alpha/FixB family protein [Haloarchaeobius amylolyticus]|uniref:Electron transfer flavoprotein subunit alpha/FixB family protein n=1 Tax=Haloarchaeobius amylolyticus TaxID=1198296 RepID=A0ABD6BIZ2_9EURY
MTGPIVTVPDTDDGALLAEAHRLAEALEADGERRPDVLAVALDGIIDPEALTAGRPDAIVHVVREDGTFARGAAAVSSRAAALATLARDVEPLVVALPESPDTADLAAATARRLRGGCVTDCLLRVRAGEVRAGRPAYSERAYAELSFERGPPVVTLNVDALGTPESAPSESIRERTYEVTVGDDDRLRSLGEREVPESDLAKARRIVAGGYGLGDPDGFEVIEEVADALGAAIGASRPPADEEWVPYDRQIGVTGKEIDTELYVPCAISGDPYHMRAVNAEFLLAINTDPSAQIFNAADLGIVGDVYEYGPALAAAIREATADDELEASEEVPQ